MSAVYCAIADVTGMIPGVTSTVLADATVTTYIEDAQNIIDTAVAGKYAVPFTATIPGIVKTICKNIAAYYVARHVFGRDDKRTTEWLAVFKAEEKRLEKIAAGESVIVDAAGTEKATSVAAIKGTNQGQQEIFDVDEPEAWAVNSDRLDGIADNR